MANVNMIKPDTGKWLTQANVKDEKDRFFSDMMFLGCNDSADNYIQWTDAQKAEWEKNHAPEEIEEIQ